MSIWGRYAVCCYTQCCIFTLCRIVILLSVVMVIVIRLKVVLLGVELKKIVVGFKKKVCVRRSTVLNLLSRNVRSLC